MSTGTIEARKQRWRDAFDLAKPPRHLFFVRLAEGMPEGPELHPDKRRERLEWAWKQYQVQMERTEWLDDDAVPYLTLCTGTEVFAEAFGCDVYRPADAAPSARPLIRSASEVAGLRVPGLDTPPFPMLFGMADELRARAGDDALLGMVDIQSPMDIAALIWDKNLFYVGIVDTPDAVKELAAKVRQLLVAFFDEWFSRYGTDYIAHYPDYYMPQGITLSEDEAGAVNAEMFEEFFLPELVELSERYGGIGIHCCADARHQWANFRKVPALRLLNLVQPDEEIRAAYPYFADCTAQMHSWCGEGAPASWPAQYPEGSRVVMDVSAETRAEAAELAHKLRALCG